MSRDRALTPDLTDAIYARFDALGAYSVAIGADGILFTGSAFGPAIERVANAVSIPVLKPSETMFTEAITTEARVGMLATFEPSISSMEAEFKTDAANARASVTLESVYVPDAMAALLDGNREKHDIVVAEAAPALAHCSAIMLAQFSMAPAAAKLRQRLPGVPVLTSPGSAVAGMKKRIC